MVFVNPVTYCIVQHINILSHILLYTVVNIAIYRYIVILFDPYCEVTAKPYFMHLALLLSFITEALEHILLLYEQ